MEADVCDCGKQSFQNQPIGLIGLGIVGAGMCQTNQGTGQLIL